MSKKIYKVLEDVLPPMFARSEVQRLIPGVNARTLANLASLGEGPEQIKIGKKVFYYRDSFIKWVVSRKED